MRISTNIHPQHMPFKKSQIAVADQRMSEALALLAQATIGHGEKTAAALNRRATNAEMDSLKGLERAKNRGLVTVQYRGELSHWVMLDAGWAACGVQKPMWLD